MLRVINLHISSVGLQMKKFLIIHFQQAFAKSFLDLRFVFIINYREIRENCKQYPPVHLLILAVSYEEFSFEFSSFTVNAD